MRPRKPFLERSGKGQLYPEGKATSIPFEYEIYIEREVVDTTHHQGKSEIPGLAVDHYYGTGVTPSGNPPDFGKYLLKLEEGDWLAIEMGPRGFDADGDFFWKKD